MIAWFKFMFITITVCLIVLACIEVVRFGVLMVDRKERKIRYQQKEHRGRVT